MGEANCRSAQKSGGAKARRDRRALEALERVEPRHRNGAEPRRDRRPGPQRDVADASQARPRHVGDGFLVEAERRERQIVKELGERLVAQGLGRGFHARKPRQRPGRARIAGGADGDGDSLRGSRARQSSISAASPSNRWATPEMSSISPSAHRARRAGCSGSTSRRGAQKLRFFKGSASTTMRAGKRARASGSERPEAQAEPRGLSVDADEPLRIVDFGDRDQRRRLDQRGLAAARGRSPDAAARGREIAWSSTPMSSKVMSWKVMSWKVMSWLRHSRRMTRPGSCACSRDR